MAATTKVYRVMVYDNMIRHYHFATKREAKVFARDWSKENNADGEFGVPEIDTLTVSLNARGIADALDDFISLTCANEG